MPILFTLIIPIFIIISIGPALLGVAGIIQRIQTEQLTLEFLKSEAISGALVLRLSSILITYHILKLEVKRLSFSFNSHRNPLRYARNREKQNVAISEMQFLFYGVIAAALWKNLLDGNTSYAVTFSAWALIYILDDWSIIQEYLVNFSIAPSLWLYYKIYIFNIILLISLFVILFSGSSLISSLFFSIPLVFILPYWFLEYSELKIQIDKNKLSYVCALEEKEPNK